VINKRGGIVGAIFLIALLLIILIFALYLMWDFQNNYEDRVELCEGNGMKYVSTLSWEEKGFYHRCVNEKKIIKSVFGFELE
jgi:hypothetical protein|tara:strand:- start:1550 stop:1795 length:246 start_codon:yes stop_codon:yes gene_type:complete